MRFSARPNNHIVNRGCIESRGASPTTGNGPLSAARSRRLLVTALTLAGLVLCVPSQVSAQFQLAGFDASAIAVSDGNVYVGNDGGPITAGAVHIFASSGEGWVEVDRIEPRGGEPNQGFGSWLAISGDRMLVGARETVHVFERDDGQWSEVSLFEPGVPVYGGIVSGDLAVLRTNSAFLVDGNPLRVLRRGPDGWSEAGEVEPPEGVGTNQFGASVAVVGGMVAVGAPDAGGEEDEDGEYTPGPGAVYLFTDTPAGWTQVGDPLTPRSATPSTFGAALASAADADGLHLFVSTWGDGAVQPSIEEFEFDAESGEWTNSFTYGSPMMNARRPGRAPPMAVIAGNELWIGGISPGPRGEGQVLRFATSEGGGRMLTGILAPATLEPRGGFGGQIAVHGSVAAVEASGRYNRAGVFHVFERMDEDWTETGEIWVEAPNYTAINGTVGCEDGRTAAFGCSEVEIMSFMPVREMGADRGVRANDVWGWTDPDSDREYALVGLSNATSFVDITDPEAPRYLGRMMMPETANSSAWRDIKVYENHAFVVSDGAGDHGMQVFDLTRLREVGSEPVEFAPDAHYTAIASAHNIVINETTGFAYSVGSSGGGESCGGGLHMIDIRDPKNPAFAGCFGHEGTGRRGTGYSHDAMCITYAGPDEEYTGQEVCFGANETAISIADVTDKSNPMPISQATYPNVAYAHQGWITDDHRYFYLGDEGDEGSQTRQGTPFPGTRTLMWDVTDLDDPVFVGEHFGETASTDHNMYVVGDLLYQSNYTSGLRILDISDRENPREVGFIDTVPYDDGVSMSGSWSNYPYFKSGTVIVTSGREGLFMVRYRKPIT